MTASGSWPTAFAGSTRRSPRSKWDEYDDTWDVWEKTRWLAGIKGARCTTELKVRPRLAFQRPRRYPRIRLYGRWTGRKTRDAVAGQLPGTHHRNAAYRRWPDKGCRPSNGTLWNCCWKAARCERLQRQFARSLKANRASASKWPPRWQRCCCRKARRRFKNAIKMLKRKEKLLTRIRDAMKSADPVLAIGGGVGMSSEQPRTVAIPR